MGSNNSSAYGNQLNFTKQHSLAINNDSRLSLGIHKIGSSVVGRDSEFYVCGIMFEAIFLSLVISYGLIVGRCSVIK